MISEELLREVKLLEFRIKKIVNEQLTGDFNSVFHGRGIDFSELREYTMGDDVRTIDWNVTAKLQTPFVKVYREDREQSIIIMLDRSASFLFGSGSRSKKDTATHIAALLAYLTLLSNDRCGLMIFTDQIEVWIPPAKGRAHIWNILRKILEFQPKKTQTNLKIAADGLLQRAKTKSSVFLISDFETTDYEAALRKLSFKHKIYAAAVVDPAEIHLPDAGLVSFSDRETDHRVAFNLSSLAYKETYEREVENKFSQIQNLIRRSKGSFLTITTQDALGHKVRELLTKP